jgi:hypothetical protein
MFIRLPSNSTRIRESITILFFLIISKWSFAQQQPLIFSDEFVKDYLHLSDIQTTTLNTIAKIWVDSREKLDRPSRSVIFEVLEQNSYNTLNEGQRKGLETYNQVRKSLPIGVHLIKFSGVQEDVFGDGKKTVVVQFLTSLHDEFSGDGAKPDPSLAQNKLEEFLNEVEKSRLNELVRQHYLDAYGIGAFVLEETKSQFAELDLTDGQFQKIKQRFDKYVPIDKAEFINDVFSVRQKKQLATMLGKSNPKFIALEPVFEMLSK